MQIFAIAQLVVLFVAELDGVNWESATHKFSNNAYLDPCKAAGYSGDVALTDSEYRNAKKRAIRQTINDSLFEVYQVDDSEISQEKDLNELKKRDEEFLVIKNEIHQELKKKMRERNDICQTVDKAECQKQKIRLRDEIMKIRIKWMRLKTQQRLLKYKKQTFDTMRNISNVESQSLETNMNTLNVELKNGDLNSQNNRSTDNCVAEKIRKPQFRQKRGAISNQNRLWQYGVIPYTVDSVFPYRDKLTFILAMELWEHKTCILFKEKEPEDQHYIVFTKGECGCCSFVGRGGGAQAISIGDGCEVIGIVTHELGHVIGFYHEHTRPDREEYIKVVQENIKQSEMYNFNIQSDIDSLNETYDYGSIMHYSNEKFALKAGLRTLDPRVKPGVLISPVIGQRFEPSQGDITQVNKLYRCPTCGSKLHKTTDSFSHVPTRGKPDLCQWHILSAHGQRIVLNITNLALLYSENCETDYLEVRDGHYVKSPLIRRICGKQITGPIRSTGNRMWIELKTSNGDGQGFNASYVTECGGEITKDEGFLLSPNYPRNYPSKKECVWTITVAEHFQVALMFDDFHLQSSKRCTSDYIEVRDGPFEHSPLIDTFCGLQIPENIQSSDRYLYVKFRSDWGIEKRGFSARFVKEIDECSTEHHGCDQVCVNTLGSYYCSCRLNYQLHSDGKRCEPHCGGIIEEINGTIMSPSFPDLYPADRKCTWQINAPPGYKIHLNFTYFDLETQGHECIYDSVTVKSDTYGLQYGIFCGYVTPAPIIAKGNTLRIEFTSDHTVQNTGFSADFVADRDECAAVNGGCEHSCTNTVGSYNCECDNGFVLDVDKHSCKVKRCQFEYRQQHGYIRSTNFPNHYPGRENCVWHVRTVEGHRVRLTFIVFEVEPHQLCDYDNLAVYDGDNDTAPMLGKFCGDIFPDPVISNGSSIFLTFFTDASVERIGFKIEHDAVCGAHLVATDEEKVFVSHPGFGHEDYDSRQDCQWTIQAKEPGLIQLRFTLFELESHKDCGYDVVTVYDGLDDTDNVIGEYCGIELPDPINSSSGALLVHFISDDTINRKGFSATYQLVSPLTRV